MSANAPSPHIQISIHVNNVHNVQYPCRGRHARQGMSRLLFYFHTQSNLSTYRSMQPYVPPHSKSTMTPACTRTTKQCKVASPKRLISACSSRPRRSNQRCNLQDTGWCMLCSRKRWSGWEEYMRFNCGRGRRKRRRGRSLRQSRMQGKQDKVDWKMRNRFWKEVTTFASYIDWSGQDVRRGWSWILLNSHNCRLLRIMPLTWPLQVRISISQTRAYEDLDSLSGSSASSP